MTVTNDRSRELAREQRAFENYAEQLREQHRRALEELTDDQKAEIRRLAEQHEKQSQELEKAFQVDLSRQAEKYADVLEKRQKEFTTAVDRQEKAQDKNFDQLRAREIKRIEAYRKNQEEVLAEMHKEFQETQAAFHDSLRDE